MEIRLFTYSIALGEIMIKIVPLTQKLTEFSRLELEQPFLYLNKLCLKIEPYDIKNNTLVLSEKSNHREYLTLGYNDKVQLVNLEIKILEISDDN